MNSSDLVIDRLIGPVRHCINQNLNLSDSDQFNKDYY